MKTLGIEVIKPKVRKKTNKQIHFSCSRKDEVPVNTENDLRFMKTNLRLVNVQKFF